MSLLDFSRLLNVTPSAVHFWVTGIHMPRLKVALKIEKVTKGEVPLSTWGMVITPSGRMYRTDG